jgi:SAM-dependent methyltransferase
MVTERKYEGAELALFAHAVNWKAYWASKIAPFVKGRVLEVGAGIGSNAITLLEPRGVQWTLLEPDSGQCDEMRAKIRDGQLPSDTEVRCGILMDLPAEPTFDTIIYIDVLEHIEDDRAELSEAARRLRPGGCLIVLSPAYQFLFSPFDAAIGHYRRYSRKGLLLVADASFRPVRSFYLDSLGALLSLLNRLLVRQSMPSASTIKTWDSLIVPMSRLADPLLGFSVGRSVVGIWAKAT